MDRHNAFLRRLYGSSFGVFVVAAWMHRLKRTVKIYPVDAAPFGEDPNKYVDKGDLLVTDEKGKFYFLVPPGVYYITIEEKMLDGSYREVLRTKDMELKKGVVKEDFLV